MNIKKLATKFLIKNATTPSLNHKIEIGYLGLDDHYTMQTLLLSNKITPELKQELNNYSKQPSAQRKNLKTGICIVIYNENDDCATIKLQNPNLTSIMPPNPSVLIKEKDGQHNVILKPKTPVTKEEFFINVKKYLQTAKVTFLDIPTGSPLAH